MMLKVPFSRIIVLGCLLAVNTFAGEPTPTDHFTPAKLLSLQFEDMHTMRAAFTQRIRDEKGGVLQEASGQLLVKRPRQFFWKTETPYEHLAVANGETLWLYDIDLEQITRQPFTDDLDRAPALILSGESDALAQQYAISVEEKQQAGRINLEFTLIPHGGDNVFRKLLLTFQEAKIVSMVMEDSFQQLTEINFSQVEYNQAIDPKQFQFSPPVGIDVIDNEQ